MSRKKLDEWSEERLVPITYSSEQPKKTREKKRYYMQVDCDRLFSVSEKLTKTAMRVASLMLRDVNHFTGIFEGTYEEIEETLQLSQRPVREAIAELQQADFMRRYKNGRYMINPDIAVGCGEDYIADLQDKYHSLKTLAAKRKESGRDVNR